MSTDDQGPVTCVESTAKVMRITYPLSNREAHNQAFDITLKLVEDGWEYLTQGFRDDNWEYVYVRLSKE